MQCVWVFVAFLPTNCSPTINFQPATTQCFVCLFDSTPVGLPLVSPGYPCDEMGITRFATKRWHQWTPAEG